MTQDKSDKKTSIITQKDILILKQLLEDGRKSSSSISKEIDLGREIVNYRIKRLIKENLIVKFVPKINDKAMNYQEYIILLKLNLDDELSKEEFIKQTIGNKYLVWSVKSKNGWDLVVRLYAESIEEFKEKLSEILELFSDVLTSYYTIISNDEIKEEEKQTIKKNLFDDQKKNDFEVIKNPVSEDLLLDNKDKEILKILEQDARIQYKEIANKLDISSDTVKYRIDKMKDQGVIENFMPVLNFNKLGLFQYAAILKFGFLTKEENEKILIYLKNHPQIIRAIKSINCEEFFLSIVSSDEKIINEIEKEIYNKFPNKITNFDIFPIE